MQCESRLQVENKELKEELKRLQEVKEALEVRIKILEGKANKHPEGQSYKPIAGYLQEEQAPYSNTKKDTDKT